MPRPLPSDRRAGPFTVGLHSRGVQFLASRYYSNKQIDRIVAAGGGLKNAALRPNLWRELEGLALAYEIPIYIAPPGRVRSSADKIAKQAKRLAHLLDELGADDETSGLVAGSLAGLVSVGADEPASFGLSLDTSGLPILFSSGERVSYAVVGNTLTASTCFGQTNFDTKMQVWCGSCENLACVAAADNPFAVNTPPSNCPMRILRSTFLSLPMTPPA